MIDGKRERIRKGEGKIAAKAREGHKESEAKTSKLHT